MTRVSLGAAGLAATQMWCREDVDERPISTGRPGIFPRGIVLITADDLGWRDVGAYGLGAVPTPGLDRLVEGGFAFDHAFDVVSTCSSSRATFVTGQYPHTHGVTGLAHRHPELSLPPDHPTFVRTLWKQGVVTGIQGKWHISGTDQPDVFAYDQHLPIDLDQKIRTTRHARTFLETVGSAPFYLELNFTQTHRDETGEFKQVEGFEVSPDDATPPDWWGLPDWPEIRREVAGYFSQLRWMDSLIGEVLDSLDELGLADGTLVVFISDNGPAFPGCKLTLYDRGLGTPLVFRWPAAFKPGWSSELVSSVQLAPTILELAGAPPLPGAQGRSLAPLLLGGDWKPTDTLFAEMEQHVEPIPARSARTRRHKYVRNLSDTPWGSGDGTGSWKKALAEEPGQTFDELRPPEELYALDTDPLERINLVDDPEHAQTLDDLRERLEAHMAATADPRRNG